MGTDIHLFIEKRASADAPWEAVRPDRGYHNRNYSVFAMLAGVRNGRGFAGCDLGDGFVPVAEPRGWPSDMSKELSALVNASESDEFDDDAYEAACDELGAFPGDHTPSHLTLRELLDYNWDQSSVLRGVASWNEFLEATDGRPNSYCGDISGPCVKIISLAEAESLRRNGMAPDSDTYVRMSWTMAYRECAGGFCDEFLPSLAKYGDPENVRIVFNFDS